MSDAPPPGLAERLAGVRDAIADASRDAGRDPDGITLIVVTKFHPASLVRELAALGQRDFGENRHQEARPKAASLTDIDATWHFVGQLQSNKARQVREYADFIHTLDRESLVAALGGAGRPVDVFLQLNLTDDLARGGARESDLPVLAERVLATPGLSLRGLMAVAPLGEEPRRAFERVRLASELVRRTAPEATALSMGMSGDFADAIREGATHLRIGTAITGNRPTPG
ncbi:YggS family pyridoxal phosphate-dependent enzyme [Antiquaquibacter soli]|uniref:Pyridoxal phosphate homeostasis protein n=1 Tax=Antiquaquibacter soli TaxID=3064523 RepID=A0ABT9BLE4_9MICO|nr:YggS family pyridoxal phosphate-dependent enzyme [Protaetiibacter sp. WY-16]MDO7881837.1 YggS family pyridoxal phosphate-dependent enzyme [Protaetiibacter sp. WY-16]